MLSTPSCKNVFSYPLAPPVSAKYFKLYYLVSENLKETLLAIALGAKLGGRSMFFFTLASIATFLRTSNSQILSS